MKTLSVLVALVNSLFAVLLIAASLSGSEIRQAPAWWSLTKVLAALSVIVISILIWSRRMRSFSPSLVFLCSLFLVALGAATAVWTLHLGVVSGDMEFYMIAYGGSLMVQGAASLFAFPSVLILERAGKREIYCSVCGRNVCYTE